MQMDRIRAVQMEPEFEQDEAPLSYYLEVAKRRLPLMLGVAVLILVAAAVVAVALPPLYQSSATILVESQQIPSDLVRSTVTGYATERIEVLRQQVMTRENLLGIINKYGLYKDAGRKASPSDLVDRLRSHVTVQTVDTALNNRARRSNESAIAFSIAFENETPQTAQKVTEELVNLFLNKNVTTRTRRAEDTTIFLTDQAKDLDKQVTATESKIAAYKAQYKDSLPENLTLNRANLEAAQTALRETLRSERLLDQQNTYLRMGAQALGKGGGSGGDNDLLSLKARLSSMMGIYGAAHPDVMVLKRRIAALEAQGGTQGAAAPSSEDEVDIQALAKSGDPAAVKLAAQLASNYAEIKDLKDTEARLTATIADLQARTERTPQVEQGLLQMQRDYDNALAKYREIKSKELEAQVSQNLEEEQKAERLTMLERPIAPDRPTKPDRIKILLLGFVLSMAGGMGTGVLAEGLDQNIRGRRTLERLLGEPLLGTVPLILTDDEMRQRRRRKRLFAGTVLIALVLAVLAVHFFYMPLDLVWIRLVQRFGG
jgi:protein tyrosine kinase modulator